MDNPSKQAERICNILLDMGIMLLGSGAHCGRIVRNLERVAEPWGYKIEVFSSFTGLIISMHEKDNPHNFVTRFRRSPVHNINFTTISEISIASWKVPDESLTPEKFSLELDRIKTIQPYKRWQVMLGVGFACAALCMVSGGSWENCLTAFIASMCGVLVRHEFSKKRFNVMIACAVGAFITSTITGLGMLYHIGASPESALATSVLYLVPGVPLINSVIDLIEGHIPTSMARAAFACYILLSIAVGMTASIFLIGIQNF